jgi:hypothetical protein
MPEFNLSDVTCLVHEATRELSTSVDVLGVLSRRAGSAYVEILVSITGSARDAHQLVIGFFRNASREAIVGGIAASVRRYLDEIPCP